MSQFENISNADDFSLHFSPVEAACLVAQYAKQQRVNSMKKIITSIIINAIALWSAAWILGGADIVDGILGWLFLAIIFGLMNTFIKPIVKLLSLPFTIITLGLFTLVINTIVLMLTMWVAGILNFNGGFFSSIWAIFIAAIIVSIVSSLLNLILPDDN